MVGRWSYAPPMDVYETEKEVIVEIELPEVGPEDVRIISEGRRITVEGNKGYRVESGKVRFLRLERYSGFFRRVVELPFTPDKDGIKASMGHGVLRIRIPKQAQTIKVEEGNE